MKKAVHPKAQWLYTLLLRLYPKRFTERFGEEMKFVFVESLLDAHAQTGRMGAIAFWIRTIADLCSSALREWLAEKEKGKEEGKSMTTSKFISPNIAALLGFLLFVPGAFMISSLMLNIEPTLITQFIPPVPQDQPHIIGSLIAVTLIVVLPTIGLILNLVQIQRIRRAGGSILAHPLNLIFALACFALIAALLIGIIVDQWPCWQGVPNCD